MSMQLDIWSTNGEQPVQVGIPRRNPQAQSHRVEKASTWRPSRGGALSTALFVIVAASGSNPTRSFGDSRTYFPFLRHDAAGNAAAQLLISRPEEVSEVATSSPEDQSIEFRASQNDPPVGATTIIVTEGSSAVYLDANKMRWLTRVESHYYIRSGYSPGGETSGSLNAAVEFSMPMEAIELHVEFGVSQSEHITGTMHLLIENLTNGVALLELDNDGSEFSSLLHADASNRIRASISTTISGEVDPASPTGFYGGFSATVVTEIVDCNRNSIYDPRDIESGSSSDCNEDGVPDDCEWDCNENGRGDSCDILEDVSPDCNGNGVPDECDLWVGGATDCNANRVPDDCDVTGGLLLDQNNNGFPDACEAQILFVDSRAGPGGNGLSWQTAYADLQMAIQHAINAQGIVMQIWVANGDYRPSLRSNGLDARSASFVLPNGVALLGGFTGNESSADQRDPATNLTVLSGDMAIDDAQGFVNRGDNSYHVVIARDTDDSATLDGFVIRGGFADGNYLDLVGGGLLIRHGTATIRNCSFEGNWAGRTDPGSDGHPPWTRPFAGGAGGAAACNFEDYIEQPMTMRFEKCGFFGNSSVRDGGGVYGEELILSFCDCEFVGNTAQGGGAVGGYSLRGILIAGCMFSQNMVDNGGGAVYARTYDSSGSEVSDCSFTNNDAYVGGAIAIEDSEILIERSNFEFNSAVYSGGAVDMRGGALQMRDSRFGSNAAEYAGGGLHARGLGSALIDRCKFEGNSASSAGGALVSAGRVSVMDSRFQDNWAVNRGGGLYCFYGRNSVERCAFIDNDVGDKGGGLFVREGSLQVQSCSFTHNSADQGGGLYGEGDNLVVTDSVFEGNRATAGGGLGDGSYFPESIVQRSTFINNRAAVGGGVSALSAQTSLAMDDCLVAQNEASAYAGGIAGGSEGLVLRNCTVANNIAGALGGGALLSLDSAISDSIIWGNIVDPEGERLDDELAQIEGLRFAMTNYSIIQGWSGLYPGGGNNGEDPLFVDPEYPVPWFSPPAGDYHVLDSSPAIDTGDPDVVAAPGEGDLDGHTRVLCGRVDMGAYESGIGDFNCDGQVNALDFAEYPDCMQGPIVAEGRTGPIENPCGAFDFDADGDIDLSDFAGLQQMFPSP